MRIVSVMLVLVMMFSTVGAFADETVTTKPEREPGLKAEKLLEDYPWFAEAKDEYKAEHDVLHSELDPLRETLKEMKETTKEEIKIYVEELKLEYAAKVEVGEITKEEAIAEIRAIVEEEYNKVQNDEFKAELESLRAVREENKEERISIKENIKTAREGEETELVEELLNELLANWDAHIDIDQDFLDLFNEIYSGF